MDSQTKDLLVKGLLGLAFASLLGALGWFIFNQMQFAQYKDSSAKFAVKYPSAWKAIVKPQEGVAVVFQSPNETALDVFQENINISFQPVPDHLASLKTYSDTIRRQMTVVFKSNIKILEDKPIVFGQRAGHILIFETPKPESLKSVIAWTLKDGRAYIMTFMGRIDKYNKLKPLVDQSFQSFRFL